MRPAVVLDASVAASWVLAVNRQAVLATDRQLARAAVRTGLPLRTALGRLPCPDSSAPDFF